MIYVMSDIHGQYSYFQEMLNKIQFSVNDHLYIIGDVIDRGPDGASLFLEAVSQPNITLLLGNHELMMHDSVSDIREKSIWASNGSSETEKSFQQKGMNISDVAPMVEQLPIIIPDIKINNRKFVMVHAGIPSGLKPSKPLYMKDMRPEQVKNSVWMRDLSSDGYSFQIEVMKTNYPSSVFLFGHTPVTRCDYCRRDSSYKPAISFFGNGQFINLDCGSALGLGIGCLRLDDMQEFYVRPEEMKRNHRT